jgi:hypothetical protein
VVGFDPVVGVPLGVMPVGPEVDAGCMDRRAAAGRRRLVAKRWTYPSRTRTPAAARDVAALIERLATQNPSWGLHAHPTAGQARGGCGGDGRDRGVKFVDLAHLRRAKATSYPADMTRPASADDWQAVETFEDFVQFARVLGSDSEEVARQVAADGQGGQRYAEEIWAQGTPGAWMDAMAAWLEARYLGKGPVSPLSELEPPTWRTFAFILSESRMHE